MAKTILHHLYDGEINPSGAAKKCGCPKGNVLLAEHTEEIIGTSNDELLAIYAKIGDDKTTLYEQLPQCTLEELERIDELADKAQSVHGRECFLYGFKLGAIIIMEVSSSKDDLIHNNDLK